MTIFHSKHKSEAGISEATQLALGLGEGGEQNAPLGRAVIGGLVMATVAHTTQEEDWELLK